MKSVELKEKLESLDLENILLISITAGEIPEEEQNDPYTVAISEEDYLENKDAVDEFVKKYCSYERKFIKSIYFNSKYHMTAEIFQLLKENKSLKHIMFYNYELTKKDFDILKENPTLEEIETTILSEELSDCYDKRLSQIVKREVAGFLTVKNVIYDNKIEIAGPLSDEQVLDICTLLEKRVAIGSIEFRNFTNTESLKRIIDKITVLGKDKVTIYIANRSTFDYSCFTDENQNSNLEVLTATDETTDMNTFIKTEEELRKIIKPLEEHENELSPFEKHFWLHHLVATFREYKREDSNDDYRTSRFLNKLLFNADKSMVCVGFSYLYKDLARRLSLDTWENLACSKKSMRQANEYNHITNLIYIKDEKYDLDGVYLSDTTFDNYDDKDLFIFNHFFLTPEKYDAHIKDMYSAGYSLLTVKDKEEFISMLKEDNQTLVSLLTIISKYYPEHSFFDIAFDNAESYHDYCLANADKLYDIVQTINIEEVREDKLERALVHIEKLKNPNITVEKLEEKLAHAFEIYHKVEKKIYEDSSAATKTLQ